MKLALLKGNRFNPWHLEAFNRLPETEVTGFRAESEVQARFDDRENGSLRFSIEPIYFDTQTGAPWTRWMHRLSERFFGRAPRIAPFRERLAGFDVIQTWELFTDWTAEALAAKVRDGTPVAVMVWDNIPYNNEPNVRLRDMKRRAVASADRFIVHTERSRRMLAIEGVDESRIVKIDPGVDTEAFSPGPHTRGALGLGEDELVVLFVGWLLPRKGIDFLVLALRELLNDPAVKGRRIRLAIAGSGPGKERVESLIRRAGVGEHCTFIGPFSYEHMPGVFQAADVFALPSIATAGWQEQFGMSLIEAMACGVPVVTTQSGAIPEIVGEAGLICQPNDFVSLHHALRELVLNSEQRDALADAGRQRAVDRFSLDDYVENLSAIYGALVG